MATLLGPTFAADITMALSAGKIDRGPEDLGMADIASFCRCRKSKIPRSRSPSWGDRSLQARSRNSAPDNEGRDEDQR
jgi:hypothetical protein